MRPYRALLVMPLIFMLVLPTSSTAQERHAVSPADLARVVAGKVAQQEGDRAAIHEVLNRAEVRDIAAKTGVDLERVDAMVNTLQGTPLAQAAAAARQANETLVGGASTVVISTTTVVIALLLILLLVVAVD